MLDYLLVFFLLVYQPADQLWKSLRKPPAVKKTRIYRYWRAIAQVAVLLAALAASSWWQGRGLAALGLGLPLSRTGQWALAVTLLLLSVMVVAVANWKEDSDEGKRASNRARMESDETMPRTPAELRLFLLLNLFLGAGWEILYRGFLLLVLTPVTGVVGAVILSALAYGVAHGYTSPRQFAGSIASAFAFTIAFALTHSLWWLMLLHLGLPLIGAVSFYLAMRKQDRAGAPGRPAA